MSTPSLLCCHCCSVSLSRCWNRKQINCPAVATVLSERWSCGQTLPAGGWRQHVAEQHRPWNGSQHGGRCCSNLYGTSRPAQQESWMYSLSNHPAVQLPVSWQKAVAQWQDTLRVSSLLCWETALDWNMCSWKTLSVFTELIGIWVAVSKPLDAPSGGIFHGF